ncbi:MAG: transglutaminase TgpA family protein [Pseudonocardiaceae bacterium]
MTGFAGRTLLAAVAGSAVALAATSLGALIEGPLWWGSVVLAIAVVVATGVLLRSIRMPPIVVAAGQLATLVGLVTALFTSSGWLGVLPGPTAAAELRALLEGAAQQAQVGIPPVLATTELICLVVVVVGLVAVAVDTLAISAAVPASTGLVLLCMVTFPAALSHRPLPWWSFVLGAVGFALLLAVDSQRRQVAWGKSAGPSGYTGAAPAAVAVTAGAVVVALLVGTTVTAVGTGRSTGNGTATGQPVSGIGLSPFTSLRGQLSNGELLALFRVRGLDQPAYLRALTLSRFATRVGWQQGSLDSAVPAGEEQTVRLPLPAGVTTPVSGSTLRVSIEPIHYTDNWLPSFGYPLALAGIGPDWNYDPDTTTIFSDRRQRAEPYTELGVLPQPDPQLLREAGPAGGPPFATVDSRYLDTGGVDQRVAALTAQITASSRTAFDAAVAVNEWFTQPRNGFSYDLETAPGNGEDALVDFLFTGRQGYCEQFASAMAIMLRTLQVPARVAIGFTPGTATGDSRLITTKDAHAWVEVWFPGTGWLPFDPTPLSDGRTAMPGYAPVELPPAGDPPPLAEPSQAGPVTPAPDALAAAPPQPGTVDSGLEAGGGSVGLAVAGSLVLVVLAGLSPLAVREGRRRRRLHLASTGGLQAVSAAWEEVLAESADRGVVPPVGETVRATAARLAHEHGLDETGQAGLRTLVNAVERSWYSGSSQLGRSAIAIGNRDTDGELVDALQAVRASMVRCAPQTRMARLLPRSVLPSAVLPSSVLTGSMPRRRA